MEEYELHGCKIKFEVKREEQGYIGRGTVFYKQNGACVEGSISGSHESTKDAAYESIMEKFRNFIHIGVAEEMPDQGRKYNTHILD